MHYNKKGTFEVIKKFAKTILILIFIA